MQDLYNNAELTTAQAKLGSQAHVARRAFSSICGYGVQDPSYTFDCGSDYICAFNPSSKAFGCCDAFTGTLAYDCYLPTTCYDYGKLTIVPSGSNVQYTYSCSNIAYPYCETIFDNGMSNFDCNKYQSQTQQLQQYPVQVGSSTPAVSGSQASRSASSLTAPSTVSSISSRTNSNSSPSPGGYSGSAISSTSNPGSAVVVGPTMTATSFSMTQAVGSSSSSTVNGRTSGGQRTRRIDHWSFKALIGVCLLFLI